MSSAFILHMGVRRPIYLFLYFIAIAHLALPAKADVAACTEFYYPSNSRLLRVENKLARGRITSDTSAQDGIYGARFVTYEDGTQGVWKSHNFKAFDGTYHDSNAEMAAYKIDRYSGYKKTSE